MSKQEMTAPGETGEIEDVSGAPVESEVNIESEPEVTPAGVAPEPEVTPAAEQVAPPALDPAHYFGR